MSLKSEDDKHEDDDGPADASPPPRRRRGAALEQALLEAAWAELLTKGYDALTIEAVAERARTSRAVLYRRWPTKADLVRAAVTHSWLTERIELPDTGNLRDDLIETLRRANRLRAQVGIAIAVRLTGYFSETGSSMADLRAVLMNQTGSGLDTVFDRAVRRGEIDAARLTPRVAAVPFDLYRAELLMTLKPVSDAVIESIVDEVFLPLVRPQR